MPSPSLDCRFCASWRSLVQPHCGVLVAVSGGSDSMALLQLLASHREELTLGLLAVAHVNHSLRGVESDADERLVRETCAGLAVPLYVHRCVNPPASGREAWARRERYAFFTACLQEQGFDVCATAHTADDQAETVLMRLCRGCGVKGARGIAPLRSDGIVRPLLGTRKTELVEWLKAHAMVWRTDVSNHDTRFERNRIRHQVIPALECDGNGAVSRLAASARRFNDVWTLLEPLVEGWIGEHIAGGECDGYTINAPLDTALAREGLLEWFRRQGMSCSRVHLEGVVRCLDNRGSGIKLPGGWVARGGRGVVHLYRERARSQPHSRQYRDLNVPGTTDCGSVTVCIGVVEPADVHPRVCDRWEVLIDAGVVNGGLTLRTIAASDEIVPFGMRRTVPVVRFLKKQGFDAWEREQIRGIYDSTGRLVWLVGIRPDERFRLGPQTRHALHISCRFFGYSPVVNRLWAPPNAGR